MKKMLLQIVLLLCLGIQQGQSQWIDTNGPDSIRALVMDGTTLYAGTWREGVFLSSNNGDSWELFLPDSSACFSLAFTASDIYLGGVNHIGYTSRDSTILTNVLLGFGGMSGFVYALAVRGDSVFAGTSDGGLFRIQHWGSSLWNLTRVGFQDTAVNSLIFDAATLYAGTQMGVYSTTDAGQSWTALNSGLTTLDTRALAFKGGDLFAGTWGGGVFRSTDHGALWTPANAGLTDSLLLSIAVRGDNLFAGTWFGGVFISTDNGENWSGVSHVSAVDPFIKVPMTVHALVVDETYLFAGERVTGVWRRPLSEMITSVEPVASAAPREFLLLQNYPNPFNPSTAIKYELPKASMVTLNVYDMLGREVSVLVNEREEPGVHEATFDGSRLSSGMYVYRLRAGDYVAAKRMIVMK